MKKYGIIDGKDSTKSISLGSFESPKQAIEDLNKRFQQDRFRFWLNNGSAILEESEVGIKDDKPTNFPVYITGKGEKRVAQLGSQ